MNGTIIRLALQALLGRRRIWLLLALPLALIGLTALIRTLSSDPDAAWPMISFLGYPLVLPLVAVLAASSVLGPEVDDGSIVYLLSKPVSRHAIAISKWLVAWSATLVVGSLGVFIASLVAGGGSQSVGWLVAALAAGTTYSALFLALSAFTRHAVVAGLIFVLIWEGLAGGFLSGVAWLSVAQWGIQIGHSVSSSLDSPVNLTWALLASLAVTVGGVWFAGDRLRSFVLTGDE
ncbi:ABC transporter permease subunit [Nocardioides sp.]|uniref:ABC transporter permease n=1 Tax=Nocardioides sp. TaxID=35761 RepID=UPI00286E1992|nr:ABC transporter permease subunit [Nocardioides sp.]